MIDTNLKKIITTMKHTCYCFATLLGGMVIGSALAMLLTPKTGPEMRAAVKGLVEKEIEKVRCKCNELEDELKNND